MRQIFGGKLMALNDGSRIEAVAENVWTRITARYSIIFVSVIGFPLVGWSINEAYGVIKEMNRDQIKLTRSVDLLAQRLEFTNEAQRTSAAQTDIKIEGVKAELRDRTSGRYSNDDAGRDFKLRDQVLDQHERRITDVERKVGK